MRAGSTYSVNVRQRCVFKRRHRGGGGYLPRKNIIQMLPVGRRNQVIWAGVCLVAGRSAPHIDYETRKDSDSERHI